MRRALVSPGLGTRHAAAAAITAETNSIALVLSQSSHAVTVYRHGRAILRLGRTEVSG